MNFRELLPFSNNESGMASIPLDKTLAQFFKFSREM
jgi:hypothetical protein